MSEMKHVTLTDTIDRSWTITYTEAVVGFSGRSTSTAAAPRWPWTLSTRAVWWSDHGRRRRE